MLLDELGQLCLVEHEDLVAFLDVDAALARRPAGGRHVCPERVATVSDRYRNKGFVAGGAAASQHTQSGSGDRQRPMISHR